MSKSTASRWAAVPLALYFLYFAAGALRARFAVDDPMNLGFYWQRGLLHSAGDVITLWNNSYRPMAAWFYLPIYHFFGMNPLPYRIAGLAIVALNIFLSYRIALRRTGLTAAAALTAVLVCAHASMTPIYYNTSQIYDVLAFLFTALTLDLYMRARERGGPRLFESVLIVAMFVAALNSRKSPRWARSGCSPTSCCLSAVEAAAIPAILIALAIAYTLTRALRPNSLSSQVHYHLDISAHRFFVNAKTYLDDLFFTEQVQYGCEGDRRVGAGNRLLRRGTQARAVVDLDSGFDRHSAGDLHHRAAQRREPVPPAARVCAVDVHGGDDFFRDQPIRQWSIARAGLAADGPGDAQVLAQ